MIYQVNNLNYLWIVLILVVVVLLFIVFYLINRKTKVPDDCPKDVLGCSGCMLNCNQREDNFNGKDYLFPHLKKPYVDLEMVKPLKKNVQEEQQKFIEELKQNLKKGAKDE